MTLRVAGDAGKVEALAENKPEMMQSIVDRAQGHGLISHRFYGNEGAVMVIDEWPSEEAFQKFFTETPQIAEIMREAGVTTEPEITFWRVLDTKDEVG